MSLFKILKGSKNRIDTETTPFHEGYAYFTTDEGNGGFYIDAKDGDLPVRYHVNGTDSSLTKTGVAADAAAVKQYVDAAVIAGGGQTNTVSETEPVNPSAGDNWFVVTDYEDSGE